MKKHAGSALADGLFALLLVTLGVSGILSAQGYIAQKHHEIGLCSAMEVQAIAIADTLYAQAQQGVNLAAEAYFFQENGCTATVSVTEVAWYDSAYFEVVLDLESQGVETRRTLVIGGVA